MNEAIRIGTIACSMIAMAACSGDPPAAAPSVAMVKARFPHDDHVLKYKLQCPECHHETNAVHLSTPHPAYLKGNGIQCGVCHHGTDHPREPQACSTCHPITPPSVADETLSAKVVIHETCWRCHPLGAQPRADGVCTSCHGTKHPPMADKRVPAYFTQPHTRRRTD